jgi:hypothetical protein
LYDGRQQEILSRRARTKRETLARRKKENLRRAAQPHTRRGMCLLRNEPDCPDYFEDLHTITNTAVFSRQNTSSGLSVLLLPL